MRKLKLDLDALAVNSFATSDGSAALTEQGTIRAHSTPTIPILTIAITVFLCNDADQQEELQQGSEQPV